MAILQAIFAFISRSTGKILNAVFGWAVLALFGKTSAKQQTFLTILVAAAAFWPVLLFGTIAPKIATLVLAFVPLPESVPTWAVRLVWIALALAVPIAVGLAVAAKAPPGQPRESGVKRLMRGFPITLGIAIAFLMMFVTVPFLKIVSILKRWTDVHVTMVTDGRSYHEVAAIVLAALRKHGLDVAPSAPPKWMSAPMDVMRKLGGAAMRHFAPEKLHYFKMEDLAVACQPNDILLRGSAANVAWAQGLVVEATSFSRAYQTLDMRAQDVEKQLRQIHEVWEGAPVAHTRSIALRSRVEDIAKEIAALRIPYTEWEVLYRKTLQLGRALSGDAPLLDDNTGTRVKEKHMEPDVSKHVPLRTRPGAPAPLSTLSTADLIGQVTGKATLLAKKEIELAKAELRADIKREIAMASGLGIAGVCALITVTLLCVAAVFALATVMPGWGAAFVVAGVVLAIGTVAGLVGWGKRVRNPLEKTRKSLKEDVRWAKERIA